MKRSSRAGILLLAVLAVILLVIVYVAVQVSRAPSVAAVPSPPPAAAAILTAPIPDTAPDAGKRRRGQYLVRLGDCMSCHLAPGGEPFAGGLGLNTPFGVIYSSNISSDRQTGIGGWTEERFFKAMHEGHGDHGHLYPAFPYPWFTLITRADDDAILAYLKSTAPVRYTPPDNRLPFPFNIRASLAAWNLLFLDKGPFKPDPNRSEAWNRGAYIVNGPGHCGACHTPKNMLGDDKSGRRFHGGDLNNTVAPDLTGNPRTGLGRWTEDDIAEYLRTGRNAHASAGGPMAEVITYSTSLLTEADRRAVAAYLKTLPASPDAKIAAPDAGAMKRGAAIYSDVCSACHLENGIGQPRFFPPLGNNALVQQEKPVGVLHIILAGSRVGPGYERPSPLTMPSFAWKLSDREVADVATYIRNSWGNRAAPVDAGAVKALRGKLDLDHARPTANSVAEE